MTSRALCSFCQITECWQKEKGCGCCKCHAARFALDDLRLWAESLSPRFPILQAGEHPAEVIQRFLGERGLHAARILEDEELGFLVFECGASIPSWILGREVDMFLAHLMCLGVGEILAEDVLTAVDAAVEHLA